MKRRNNRERKLWIMNDEPMYKWFKSSKMSITKFLRTNRQDIDDAIDARLNIIKAVAVSRVH